MSDKTVTGPPPWWRYYEPPRWFPRWLHRLACTHCRGLERYGRQLMREWRTGPKGGAA